jgi:CheY-like chemotaxis protein
MKNPVITPRRPTPNSEARVPALNGVQLLVVDDDPDSLALSREIPEATGATVITADNGRDALEKLQRNRTNVLIADLGTRSLRGDGSRRTLPFVRFRRPR